ncbi:KGG domain-containing protein [Janthinobacterium sp. PC23-8]|uniref:KGG domain-containing protein n=1 Tax=Janthinobacterium sp. PC23-8 TaxID=2012679 RepID=UPI000B96024F|nr:KGG domain-containing protein [Janthinobacterium sp. PC23-8]OYO30294.1 hypothetical protein CD932_03465 [Janthinobacterium sp. PC23-8]
MATSSDNKPGQQGGKASGSSSSGSSSGGNKQSDTSKRGFASMDPEQQREIASEGGRAAHEKGTAHEFTSEEARRAGSQSHKNDGNRQSASTAQNPGGRDDASMKQDNPNKQSGSSGSSGSGGSRGS